MATEAERLIRAANAWENGHTQIGPDMVSPQMLRDAAAEIERLKSEMEDQYPCIERLRSKVAKQTKLLRQAYAVIKEAVELIGSDECTAKETLAAIKQHLGEQT